MHETKYYCFDIDEIEVEWSTEKNNDETENSILNETENNS